VPELIQSPLWDLVNFGPGRGQRQNAKNKNKGNRSAFSRRPFCIFFLVLSYLSCSSLCFFMFLPKPFHPTNFTSSETQGGTLGVRFCHCSLTNVLTVSAWHLCNG
jgi:hypothetical protein